MCIGSALLFSLLHFEKTPVTVQASAAPVKMDPGPAPEPKIIFQDNSHLFQDRITGMEAQLLEREQEISQLREELQIKEQSAEEADTLLQKLKLEGDEREEALKVRLEEMELGAHQKQQIIQQLETQIHDLRYEIKTLLQLTEVDYSKFVMEQPKEAVQPAAPFQGVVKRDEEARLLLRRCLDLAQRVSTGYRSASQNISADPSALDLRRLIDALKEESGALVLLYNPTEKKMLYASKEGRNMVGWAPESLAHDFAAIAEEGLPFWDSAISQLATKPQSSLVLGLKTKGGDEIAFNALLGSVSNGVFRGYVIAVLYLQ